MRTRAALAAAALAAGLAAVPAVAQAPPPPPPGATPGATPGPNGLFSSSGAPIDVSADGLQNFHDEGRTVYTGNVEVLQGQTRLRTPMLTLFSQRRPASGKTAAAGPGGDFGALERAEAEGPVYYVTPTESVKGDHGTYLATPDTITVTGDVTLVQGQDVLHGDKLVIEQKTGHSTMITNTPGKTANRVRGVYFPNRNTTAGPSAPPAAAPRPGARPGA